MKTNHLAIFCLTLASGCAATYRPPVSLTPRTSESFYQSSTDVFNAAKRALVISNYQITNADDLSGIISTAPRDFRVTPDKADCGSTMGIDYLLDNRTSTRVALGVVVYGNSIEITANIQGEYRPGDVAQDITLTCVSKGIIEKDMLHQIKAQI